MELYYLCSKNKGADQLCSCCEADLLFSHMPNVGHAKAQFISYLTLAHSGEIVKDGDLSNKSNVQ